MVFFSASLATAKSPDILLSRGEKAHIRYENVQKIVIEDEKIADVTVDYPAKQIEITGKEPGETELVILTTAGNKKSYAVKVFSKGRRSTISEIRELIENFQSVNATQKGSKILVRGSVQSEREIAELNKLIGGFPEVIQQVQIKKENSFRVLEKEIQSNAKLPHLEVQVTEERIFLKGEVYDESSRANAEKIAGTYGKPVMNLIHVIRPMIEMDVKIVQVDIGEGEAFGGNILKNLGVTMEGQAGSDTGPHFLLSTQATASLNILVNHGKAKILSEPHLTSRSGEHATFHSGGEIGFRVSGVGHADVKFKEYGLILQIEPHITEQENIESHISLEISSPTSAPASSQDVGFTKFNAESHLIGKPNETIIIAGLAENIERRFQEQTPLLSDIPVLSLFFKQEQNQLSRKELLMIVTPTLSKVEKNADYMSHSIRQKEDIENLLTDENEAP